MKYEIKYSDLGYLSRVKLALVLLFVPVKVWVAVSDTELYLYFPVLKEHKKVKE